MKFNIKAVLAAAVLAMAFSTVILAADTQFAGESMAIGVGARPLGMGGTFAAIADDASTSYWNPAGMTNIQGVEVSSVKLTRINDLDTAYSYVNLVYNTGVPSTGAPGFGSFGLGWLRQAISGITLTDSTGKIIEDSTENADNAVYLAYAYPFVKGFSAGATVKILLGDYPALVYNGGNPSYSTVSYMGYGLDLGLYLNVGDAFNMKDLKGLSFGVNAQDILSAINWNAIAGVSDASTETIGLNLKPGVAYRLPIQQFEIIGAVDLDTQYQTIIHAGAEIWWNKMIAVRGGIKSWGSISNGAAGGTLSQASDWSMGASIRWYFIGVDYAYDYNELTPVQYLSIIGKF
jgi:hypothetical protein